MRIVVQLLFLTTTLLAGCRTAHDVAVTSFRVIDAPANYLRRQIDNEGTSTTTTTTTTYQSDSVVPGQPIPPPPAPGQRRIVTEQRRTPGTDVESRGSDRNVMEPKPRPSPTSPQRPASTQGAKIPYAKPVPGKPGYVYSPFDPNGGYVDVTGYTPGSKAKDPYSGKIFIVP